MKRYIFLFVIALISLSSFGQEGDQQEELLEALNYYAELPREVVYVHTNKTTYMKGEQIGFTAYAFNKESKKLSYETANLYVTISDKNNIPIRQKLYKVDKGVTIGDFVIDSLFTTGKYTLKAYTNWMKNFKEQNFFVQAIEIIDPQSGTGTLEIPTVKSTMDAQFLPEGGHLVMNTENTIGVVVKDSLGFGIANIEGAVYDKDDNVLHSFKVNRLGLGKFSFNPGKGQTYSARMRFNGEVFSFPLPLAQEVGFSMQLLDEKDTLRLLLKTNETSLATLAKKQYTLLVNNGSNAKIITLPSFSATEIEQSLPHDLLFSGVNILTVFDMENNPISERLYFKHEGLSFLNSNSVEADKKNDSITVKLSYGKDVLDSLATISVSVLPEGTISYRPHHNIASYNLLHPYLNGRIEDGGHYFTDINKEKIEALDLLLLTQGWSSYSWEQIFNSPPDYDFDFENGIGFILERKAEQETNLVLYPYAEEKLETIPFPEGQTRLEKNGLFPYAQDTIRIGEIGKRGKMITPDLELTFRPNKIPSLDQASNFLYYKKPTILETNVIPQEPLGKGIEELDEAVVTAKKKRTELEILQSRAFFSTIEEIDDKKRDRFITFANYIRQNGFNVEEFQGDFIIRNRQPPFGEPIIIYNDMIINPPAMIRYNDSTPPSAATNDLSILSGLQLSDIRYIEVNKSGLGEGFNEGGVIKIYDRLGNSSYDSEDYRDRYSGFVASLVFNMAREFYVPKYSSFSSDFYQLYGVMGWFPKLKPDKEGVFELTIPDTGKTDLKLFVEGVTREGVFISERMNLTVD